MDVEVFSFFSGLGFLDLGFENAGFNIVFVNEHDKRFLSAYQYARRNGEHTPTYGYSEKDVREYLSDELWKKTFPNYDNREEKLIGFIGGPPCPDFSTAGKNKGENGGNGQLISLFLVLISAACLSIWSAYCITHINRSILSLLYVQVYRNR